MRKDKRPRVKLEPYDTLHRVDKTDGISTWQGEKHGQYRIRQTKPEERKGKFSPVAMIYQGPIYFTGLFATRKPGEFSADRKDVDGEKVYLLVRFLGDRAEIYERR